MSVFNRKFNSILQAVGSPEKVKNRGLTESDGEFPKGSWDGHWPREGTTHNIVMSNNGNISKAGITHPPEKHLISLLERNNTLSYIHYFFWKVQRNLLTLPL